ncbi:MAG: hypothetical protein ABI040_11805 [Rhodoferax sp.]
MIAAAKKAKRVVVTGASFIGLEVAAPAAGLRSMETDHQRTQCLTGFE